LTHLVFNSVPRSGQVFLSNVAQKAYHMPISTAHLPEIFGVKELYHVSIFRNPSDAIASLLNKLREHSTFFERSGELDLDTPVARAIETYDKYINAVSNNLDNVHVVRFEDLAQDYRSVIQDISKRFSLIANSGYDSEITLDKSSPIWADKYDGHIPREKDEIRLKIEEQVSSMEDIHRLTERYQAFLAKV
jgi:predicted Rdx family selenoprotein